MESTTYLEATTRAIHFDVTIRNVFQFLKEAFFWIVDQLDAIYIFQNVSLLKLLIVIVIVGMIFSTIFVLYDGDIDD